MMKRQRVYKHYEVKINGVARYAGTDRDKAMEIAERNCVKMRPVKMHETTVYDCR